MARAGMALMQSRLGLALGDDAGVIRPLVIVVKRERTSLAWLTPDA